MNKSIRKLSLACILILLSAFGAAEYAAAKTVYLACGPFRITIDYDTQSFVIADDRNRQSTGRAQISETAITLQDVNETWIIDRSTLRAGVQGRNAVNKVNCSEIPRPKNKI